MILERGKEIKLMEFCLNTASFLQLELQSDFTSDGEMITIQHLRRYASIHYSFARSQIDKKVIKLMETLASGMPPSAIISFREIGGYS